MGTPKTLNEAIQSGILDTLARHIQLGNTTSKPLEKAIKDFISQHFTTAMLESPESEETLIKLFNIIVKDERTLHG